MPSQRVAGSPFSRPCPNFMKPKTIYVKRPLKWVCGTCAETAFGKRLNGFKHPTKSKEVCDVCDMKPRSGGTCSPPEDYGITEKMWKVKK